MVTDSMKSIWIISSIVAAAVITLWFCVDEREDLNSLFSGLALVGIIVAIFLQRMDLKIQSQEMKRSADAQEQAHKVLTKQAESMNRTALLQGYAAAYSYHKDQEIRDTDANERARHRDEARKAGARVDQILREIEEKSKENPL